MTETTTEQFMVRTETPQPEPAAQLRAYALTQAEAEEKRAELLWAEYQRIQAEVQPQIDRMEEARSVWCAAHSRARELREMFGGGQ